MTPLAVLELPRVLDWRAPYPLAVLESPEVLFCSAEFPTAVLSRIFPPHLHTFTPFTRISHETSSFSPGVTVPIPTFPVPVKYISIPAFVDAQYDDPHPHRTLQFGRPYVAAPVL